MGTGGQAGPIPQADTLTGAQRAAGAVSRAVTGEGRLASPGVAWEAALQPERLAALDLQRFADGERTQPPTPRRRQEARRRGQTARSADLSLAAVVLGGAVALSLAARWTLQDVQALGRAFWGGRLWGEELSFESLRLAALQGLVAMRGVAVVAVLVAAVAAASQVAQVGFLVSGYPLVPQLARLNPLAGLQRLFSLRSAFELLKGLAKAAVVAWAGWDVVSQVVASGARLVAMEPVAAAAWVGSLARQELLRMGWVLLIVGAADYAYQRWEYEQSLRMSREEVKDEFRQSEGDPQVRARIRSRMRQLAMQRMMPGVARASVVVTNPTHVAVALAYEPQEMEAPVVVAKGLHWMARRIVETAESHGVPVVENPPLAWSLYEAVPIGQAIPPELYRAVAEVLAFVYRLRRASPAAHGAGRSAPVEAPQQAQSV